MGKLELVQTLNKHIGRVWNLSWHPKGDSLASCGEDKTIRIWVKEGSNFVNKVILTDGHKRTIREVSWSPCGNYLASASFDGTTAIWDKKSGEFECNATLEGHENEVKSVAWSKSGQLLATCSRDKSVWVWEIAEEDEYECAAVLNAHTQDVKKVIWHPTTDIIASCSYDNTIKLFREDLDHDWLCCATLSSHQSTVWSIAFDATGSRLASCSDDCTVKIWSSGHSPSNVQTEHLPSDMGKGESPDGIKAGDGIEEAPSAELGHSPSTRDATWRCVCTLSGYHTRVVYDIAWCPHTGLLATACGDDVIRVFQEDEGREEEPTWSMIAKVEAHTEDVNGVMWNPVVKGMLASASDDGSVKIWQFVE